MASSVCGPNYDQLSLKEILELREHAVTEEEAWALCYKLCTLLQSCWNGNVHSNDTPQNPSLPGEDAILVSCNGDVWFQGAFVFSSQNKVVGRVGRLIYHFLDWGIDVDSERELSDALTHLLCRMIKIPCSGTVRRYICTLHEVIQVCVDRVADVQPAHHYKSVIASLYSEAVELYHCSQSIQSYSKSLQAFCLSDPLGSDQDGQDKVFAWRNVMQELHMGVNLRPCGKTVPQGACKNTPQEQFPFDQLNQDIKRKRYTLNKVQPETRGEKPLQIADDVHQCLLEEIKSRPKLRPVSERKLRAKPVEKPCLHERLMAEIRTTDPKRLFASLKRHAAPKKVKSRQFFSHGIKPSACQVRPPHPLRFSTAEMNCSKPISWVQVSSSLNVERRKRRIQSLGSYSAIKQSGNNVAVSSGGVSVKKVMTAYRATMGCQQNETSPSRWQVCSCCFKQSHFFTWHNICSSCDRVVCPHCCVKMQVPYKWCMELPITFFRLVVLRPGGDHGHFWKARLSWDSTKVPLVLEPHVLGSCSQHGLAMRGWYSQDICTQCQNILENSCSSCAPQNRATGSLEI